MESPRGEAPGPRRYGPGARLISIEALSHWSGDGSSQLAGPEGSTVVCLVSDTPRATALSVASHSDNGGPHPFAASVSRSGKDTTLSRAVGAWSVSATEPVRNRFTSSSSTVTIRRTREPSRVVVTTGARGCTEVPRSDAAAPIGSSGSTLEYRTTAPAAPRAPFQLKSAVVSEPSETL